MFDIFNTSFNDTLENNNLNVYKTPLSRKNADLIFDFLNKSTEYIKFLSLRKTKIIESGRKTFVLGFLVNIYNLKKIYEEYILMDKLEFIPTFQQSQDPLESFFGRIRSKLGFNRNPTQEQFKSAFRKILINTEITSSKFANCRDQLNILHVSSKKPETDTNSISINISHLNNQQESFEPFNPNDCLLDVLKETTIVHFASDIEEKIRASNFKCSACLQVLNENSKVSKDSNVTKILKEIPCESTVYTCKVAEKYINIFLRRSKFDYDLLFDTIINAVDYKHIFPKSDFNQHTDPNHEQFFIQFIVEEFIRSRATHIARNLTESYSHGEKWEKILHFKGQ